MSAPGKHERRSVYQLVGLLRPQPRPPTRRIPVRDGDAEAIKLRRDKLVVSLIVLGILLAFALLIWQAIVVPPVEVPDYYHWMP